MGREIPLKYMRSKQPIWDISGFIRGPGISPLNPKKTQRSKQGLNLVEKELGI
jgi:hypothetical protein